MALNWTMLDPDRSPIPLPDENVVESVDNGTAELTLIMPDPTPPRGNMPSGGSGGVGSKWKEWGNLWLTDQRLIFVSSKLPAATPTLTPPTQLDTLTIPLPSITSTSFTQPLLASNYLALDVKPSEGGSLVPGTKAEIRLKDRPMFQFVARLEKVRERAIYMKRESVDESADQLPLYSAPAGTSSVTRRAPAPPIGADEAPPGYDA